MCAQRRYLNHMTFMAFVKIDRKSMAEQQNTSLYEIGGLAASPLKSTQQRPLFATYVRGDFFSSTGIWSIFAAKMKSFSLSPLIAWVDSSMATFR